MSFVTIVLSERWARDALRQFGATAGFEFDDLPVAFPSVPRDELQLFVEAMTREGLLRKLTTGLHPTGKWHRARLFCDALEGAPVDRVIDELRDLDPSLNRMEVVRHGMTQRFLDEVVRQPRLGTISLCSPWLNLSEYQRQSLRAKFADDVGTGGIDITIITRPPEGSTPWAIAAIAGTHAFFRGLGARMTISTKLHAKVYLRTPQFGEGDSIAVLGSQNMTKSTYLELGIYMRNERRLIKLLEEELFTIAAA